jgi:hypothetical protein
MSKVFIKYNAITNLYPNVTTVIGDDDEAFDKDKNLVPWDESLVQEEMTRLQAEYDGLQYQRERVYPGITDQLDQLYWDKKNGTNHWEEGIDAVKAAHPKP